MRLLLSLCGLLVSTITWAAGASHSANRVQPVFDLSLGTGELNQTVDQVSRQHSPGGRLGGHVRYGAFELGANYMALLHNDTTSEGTVNQVDSSEELDLAAATAGVILGNTLILEAGYGYATFKRSMSEPKAAQTTTQNVTAHGGGWEVGGSLIPIHINRFGFGASYYYFDATASNYSSTSVSGNSTTSVSAQPSQVHSFGWFAGATLFWGF